MKNFLFFALMLMLAQSCVVYQPTTVPLNYAKDKGKVKVIDAKGTHKYNNITLVEGDYYGMKSKETHPGYFTKYKEKIDPAEATSIYLTKRVAYKIWIYLNNENSIVKGILYEARDSSIVITASTNIELNRIIEIPISEIVKIKIRRKNGIGRSAGLAGLAGFSFGALIGLMGSSQDSSSSWFTPFETTLILGAVLGVPMAVLGVIAGSIKRKFIINGSQENYNKIKYQLSENSLNK